MLKRHNGLFARRPAPESRIKAGDRFRHRSPGDKVETAEVLGVSADATGIPHVRYRLIIEQPFQGRRVEGPRVLNLQTFLAHFNEAVTLPTARAAE